MIKRKFLKYVLITIIAIVLSAIGSYIGLIAFTYTPQIFAAAIDQPMTE